VKVTKEKTATCEFKLTIEVEPERLQLPLRRAAQRLNRHRPLPGFRPGKAPYAMTERLYGKDLIYHEMLDEVGNDFYKEALQESQLEPYDRGEMEIAQLEPLVINVTVPTEPQVTLGKYGKIRVKQKAVRVSKKEVEEALARIQEGNSVWVPVEHAVAMGNQIVMDAVGTTDDGNPVKQEDITLEVTPEMQPAGFGENLVGIKPSESKEFDVEYPADFRDEDMAGKHVHFLVTIKSVKERELPALNDDLAKTTGSESMAELRAKIKEGIQKGKEEEAKDSAMEEALTALVDGATLEYPAIAVEHEVDSMFESLTRRLTQQGFTMEGYLQMMKKTAVQVREELRPQAENRLKRGLALSKFAEAEGIKVEAADIDQEVDRLALSFGEQAGAVKTALSAETPRLSITNDVYRRKALDQLLAMATGQAKAPPEESASSPE